jgi:hypothetical protein
MKANGRKIYAEYPRGLFAKHHAQAAPPIPCRPARKIDSDCLKKQPGKIAAI